MVKGIETDNKKIEQKDEKWLAKDLNEIRKIAEDYIDKNRPIDKIEINGKVKSGIKKSMPFARMIAIIIGIIGFLMILFGIYSLTVEINFLSILNTIIGIVFFISFILFEKYG